MKTPLRPSSKALAPSAVEHLLSFRQGRPNDETLAIILVAQRAGQGCLPVTLGLDPATFESLLQHHFTGCQPWLARFSPGDLQLERAQLRQQLLDLRRDEHQELTQLILRYRNHGDRSEGWLAEIIAAGCFGAGHLWQDLGLSSREHLRHLLHNNFSELVAKNVQDMRWKKYFYRLLCEEQGGMLCRVPDCQQCCHFADCFEQQPKPPSGDDVR